MDSVDTYWVYDPVDVGVRGALRRHGTAYGPVPAELWGPAGDSSWPESERRSRLARRLRLYRAAGYAHLARLVRAYAHNPTKSKQKLARAEAERQLRCAKKAGVYVTPADPLQALLEFSAQHSRM